ncbi:MAG: NADH-quinone oxidoreductase subunit NuoI [Pseudomonadota bacterium]|nr:NADH-quinone oxidoreductase subunit NuoI [Pseudomonadota bacterium]
MIWQIALVVVITATIAIIIYYGLAKRITLWELLQGMRTTQNYLTQKKVTVQFPEEELPRSPRHRGMLALRRYPNGEERCIACKLCEAVCPALAITIEAEPREDDGSRRTKRFDIDMFKCINCGLCEESCPVDSIVLTPAIHYTPTERGQNILTKDKLLAIGDLYEEQLAQDRYADKDYR